MPSLPLTKGKEVLLDESDFQWARQWKWIAQGTGPGRWYAARKKEGRLVLLHREIMGAKPGEEIDHKNCNSLDCRRENLRRANRSQNAQNSRKTREPASSKYKGVCYVPRVNRTNPWLAYIGNAAGSVKRKYLGYHPDEISAAKAYDSEARRLFGEFSRLNFPAA